MGRPKDLQPGIGYWNDGRHSEYRAKPPSSFVQRSLDMIMQDVPEGTLLKSLDAGSGGGRNSAPFIHAGCEAYAFDYHTEMVAQTQQLFAEMSQNPLNVTQQEMSQLSFSDGAFDIVLSNGVIHNAVSAEHFLATIEELSRVITPGGHLIFSVFTADEISSELVPTDDPGLYITADNLKMTLLSQEEIITALEEHGLLIVEASKTGKVIQVETGTRYIFKALFRKSEQLDQS